MKGSFVCLYLAVALNFGFAPVAIAQHEHRLHAAAAVSDLPAQRHAAEPALREGMARIHDALDALRHYEMGHMPESMAIERVDAIAAAVDYLFAHCKLDTQADASLHGMLIPLLDGVQAFKSHPGDTSFVAVMRQAVADYPRRFDDPSWPLTAETDAEHAH